MRAYVCVCVCGMYACRDVHATAGMWKTGDDFVESVLSTIQVLKSASQP